jgi:hypothetical protein
MRLSRFAEAESLIYDTLIYIRTMMSIPGDFLAETQESYKLHIARRMKHSPSISWTNFRWNLHMFTNKNNIMECTNSCWDKFNSLFLANKILLEHNQFYIGYDCVFCCVCLYLNYNDRIELWLIFNAPQWIILLLSDLLQKKSAYLCTRYSWDNDHKI